MGVSPSISNGLFLDFQGPGSENPGIRWILGEQGLGKSGRTSISGAGVNTLCHPGVGLVATELAGVTKEAPEKCPEKCPHLCPPSPTGSPRKLPNVLGDLLDFLPGAPRSTPSLGVPPEYPRGEPPRGPPRGAASGGASDGLPSFLPLKTESQPGRPRPPGPSVRPSGELEIRGELIGNLLEIILNLLEILLEELLVNLLEHLEGY